MLNFERMEAERWKEKYLPFYCDHNQNRKAETGRDTSGLIDA